MKGDEIMKRNVIKCWVLIVCLYSIGCGNLNKSKQNTMQDTQIESQNVQTKWDGETENIQKKQMEESNNSENSQKKISKPGEKVHFLGSENSFLETCRIYHGKEQTDIAPDEMENFIQMLSEYIMEAKDSWAYVLGLMDLKEINELKDMAEDEEEKYYILLQFTKPVDTVLEFGSKFGAAETMQLNGDLYILEIDESTGEFLLYYESGTDNKFISLHPIGDIDNPNKVADLLQQCEKWTEGKLTH